MSKIFYPRVAVLVKASQPHPPGTQYKVSIGPEDWGNGVFAEVVKVQMVYDGVVSGRRSPSYPVNTEDLNLVNQVTERILAGTAPAEEIQAWVDGQQD